MLKKLEMFCFVLFCVEGGYEYYFVNMIHMGGYWLLVMVIGFVVQILVRTFVDKHCKEVL